MNSDDMGLTITVAQAAKLLGIGRNSAYAAIERGEIPSVRFGRRIVVPTQKLLALVGVEATADHTLSGGDDE